MKPILYFPSHYFFGAVFVLAATLPAQTPPEVAPVPLEKIVDEIVAKNPELRFYEAEISAAKVAARISTAIKDPELSVDVGHKRVEDRSGVLLGSGTAWSVSVTQTFEWPGRLSLRKAIANRQVELAELGLARFQNALAARARAVAFGLYAANAKASAVREVADRFAALKQVFVGRDPGGITPLLETRVIEASELALQRRAVEAELAVRSALIELNQLRGLEPDAALRIAPPKFAFNDGPSSEALLAAARENNFEFRIRRVELQQQGYEVRLARHERYPAIDVKPFVSRETAGDRETVLGLGVSLPLPISGRTRGAVEMASARQRQAEAAAILAERELTRDVLIAAESFALKVAESKRWAPDAVTKFREAADLADRHYRLGAVPIATYVELQTSYLDAVEALLETQREAIEAGLKLQQLTGLGSQFVEVVP
ncbi:transporter [Opitutaceae bacterium EW11]|nr:transporter [Opitutaceae bacterium EW11]